MLCLQMPRSPFHKRSFQHNSNLMEMSLSSHPNHSKGITMEFCTGQDSCAVMACAKLVAIQYPTMNWYENQFSIKFELRWRNQSWTGPQEPVSVMTMPWPRLRERQQSGWYVVWPCDARHRPCEGRVTSLQTWSKYHVLVHWGAGEGMSQGISSHGSDTVSPECSMPFAGTFNYYTVSRHMTPIWLKLNQYNNSTPSNSWWGP